MGKASRVRNAKAEMKEMKKAREAEMLRLKKKKTLATIITAAVSVLLVAIFATTIIVINYRQTSGDALRSKTAFSSKNFSINAATFAYFLNYQYTNFANNYSDNLTNYGLDVSIPLRDQDNAEGENWFDYFVKLTEKNLKEIFVLAEYAKDNNIALDDSDKKDIDDFFKDLEAAAKSAKTDLKTFIHKSYGLGVNEKDIREGLELSVLASKCYEKVISDKTYSENEILDYFEANKNDFLGVDYKYYNFTPQTTNDMTDDEKIAENNKAIANADKLAAAKDPTEFDNILKGILKENGTSDANIESLLKNTYVTGSTYDPEFKIAKWAFGDDSKLHDTQIYVNGTSRGVYMIAAKPYRNEEETRSVRHILIKSTDETDADAKAKAEKILKEYTDGEKTEERFGELATKYTEDTGSAQVGGLYENFGKGQMVAEFENWAFDQKRNAGDTEIVKTTYGYHIMYFVEKGLPIWKNNTIAAMKDKDFEKLYDSLEKEVDLKLNTKVLEKIPTITLQKNTQNTATTTQQTSSHDHDEHEGHNHD